MKNIPIIYNEFIGIAKLFFLPRVSFFGEFELKSLLIQLNIFIMKYLR